MGATGADRKHFRSTAHENDLFVSDMTEALYAIGKFSSDNA